MSLRVPARVLARIPAAVALFVLLAPALGRAQQLTLPLWPHGTPEPAQTTEPEADVTKPTDGLISGHRTVRYANVTKPTLTLYPARDNRSGTAAVVFPGGGYVRLAWNGEGTDVCGWLNSINVTCILVKYRVPEPRFPASYADLEDAQQAMRITRAHAKEWHIDPNRVGVIGFSAGGNLATLLSSHFADQHVLSTPAAPDVNASIDAHPNFQMLLYPAYLAIDPAQTDLDPNFAPTASTPPTFIAVAENDKLYAHSSLVFYRALLDAGLPAELHFFSTGGHGFGVYPVGAPDHWTELAAHWLRNRGFLPAVSSRQEDSGPSSTQQVPSIPCPNPTLPTPGRPDPKAGQPVQSNDPNCPNP